MTYVDLSVAINNRLPVYPGDPQVKVAPVAIIEKDGYNDHSLHMGTHAGTHIDAPNHMLANGQTLDQFPVETFTGRGRYIKVDKTFDLPAVKAADITEGDIVLFHTGMDAHIHDPEYFEDFPAMPEAVAQYLVDRKVKMVGVDTCSPDGEPFAMHKLLLGGGVLIIENLTNLQELAGKKFTVYAFPIKLQVDGAPARVVAEVQS